jgi:hypothetical protein
MRHVSGESCGQNKNTYYMFKTIFYENFVKEILKKYGTAEQATGKGKGKAVPLQAWTGPQGSRGSRLTDFHTFRT